MQNMIFLGSDIDIDSLKIDLRNTIVITFSFSREIELRKKGYNVILFHRRAQDYKIWKDIVQESEKWLTQNNLKSIDVKFENVSLWDFVYDEIFEIPGGIFDCIYYIKTINSFITGFHPQQVTLSGNFEFDVNMIISQMSKTNNFILTDNSKVEKVKSKKQTLAHKALFLGRFTLGRISSLFRSKKDIHFILSHGYYAREKSGLVTDLYLDEIHNYFINHSVLPKIISLNLPRLHSNILVDIFYDFFRILIGRYVPFEIYTSFNNIRDKKKKIKLYYKLISKAFESDIFNFKIDYVCIAPLIKSRMSIFLPNRFYDAEIAINKSRRYLKDELPKRVLNVEGFNLFGKALSMACNEKEIQIFSPQVGIISDQIPVNPGFYLPKDFNFKLAPTFLVWGSLYKELMVQRGYPKSKIIETGFWRINQNPQSTPILEKYLLYIAGANLHIASYISSLDEELFIIREIANNIMPHFKMMVKLHPTHPYRIYNEKLKDLDITILRNNTNINLQSLIENASIVLGKCSTVLLQSLLSNRKTISINLVSRIDFCGLGILNENSLDYIKDLKNLKTESFKNNFSFNSSQYCKIIGIDAVEKIFGVMHK